MRASIGVAALLAGIGVLTANTAHAGGLYLTDRGVRPMGRGFAFVAGADDPQALWYNPAGLAWSGQQTMLDASITLFDASYKRVDSGGNEQPRVDGSPPPLPIPAAAYTDSFGLEDFHFGFGVFAPNAALLDWPRNITIEDEKRPAPQRYSLVTLEGSLLANVIAGASWQPIPELSIGLAPQIMLGRFRVVTVLSACDGAICTQPENPEWDGTAELLAEPAYAPTLGGGLTWDPGPVRVGFSFVLPTTLRGNSKFRTRLPEAPLFDGARVDGSNLELEIALPTILRTGVELRAVEHLRLETTFVFEQWARQDEISIQPNNVFIRDAVGIGDYQVGKVDIPRNMNNVYSIRLGGEYTGLVDQRLALRAGLSYSSSSFDDAYLTPTTLDSDKVILGMGVGFEVTPGIWLDATYAHVFMRDRNVGDEAAVPQLNPIRPPRPDDQMAPFVPAIVNRGDYNMEADIIGVGMRWEIDTWRQKDDNKGQRSEKSSSQPPEG